MLKIKDLKKKKKGKKGKHKDDELFTAEELERYRREHQQKEHQEAEEAQANSPDGAKANGAEAESDEWRKFKALTGGVDDILKKTQGDLDRIKSTSFFQRKPTPSELSQAKESAGPPPPRPQAPVATAVAGASKKKKRWVGFEEDGEYESEPEEEHEAAQQQEAAAELTEPVVLELEEEEEEDEEAEDADDIFDTSYVDVVTSGEIKLAYIPDSPVEEETGDDPFDTSYAEKVIKTDDTDPKKKKKLVSLGCAVEVLTGKLEKPDKPPPLPELGIVKRPRAVPRRTKQTDLLLGSFDEGSKLAPATEDSPVEEEPAPKSLLDDDGLLAGIPDDLPPVGTSIPLPPPPASAPSPAPLEQQEESSTDVHSIVAEFEELGSGSVSVPEAAAPNKLEVLVAEEEEDLDDEFAALAAESLFKKGQENLEPVVEAEVDPFDTSIAAAVLVGEAAPPPVDVDVLLAGPPSTWSAFDDEEHSAVGLKPVRPPPPRPGAPPTLPTEVPDDPFDTSIAQNILPGKVELKLIEQEIIGSDVNEARILSNSDSDFDFNPRESETPAVQSGVSIHVTDPGGLRESPDGDPFDEKACSLKPIGRDLLSGSTTDLSKLADEPIEPAPAPVTKSSNPLDDVEDPFDTSQVDVVVAPGKAELKFIEKEILGDEPVKLQRGLSDEEFDPRAEEARFQAQKAEGSKPKPSETHHPKVVAFTLPLPSIHSDLLADGHEEGTKFSKPLTPYYPEVPPTAILNGDADSDVDPFDTSHVSTLEPGKAELKAIESELLLENTPISPIANPIAPLLNNPKARSVSDTLSPIGDTADKYVEILAEKPETPQDDLFHIEEDVDIKPLTPCIEDSSIVDPFDTSIAELAKPGKAELKILEKELISGELKPISRSFSDHNFNPRAAAEQTLAPSVPGSTATSDG